MQLESRCIPRIIAKLLKHRASMSSLARSRGFCRRTAAKVHCQKQQNREVALKADECLQKLQGAKGLEVDEDVDARLRDSTSDVGPSVESVQNMSSSPKKDALPKRILRSQRNLRNIL